MLQTGQPVMQPKGSVTLRLDNDEGLWGWNCFVNREDKTHFILLKLKKDNVSLEFQTSPLAVPETTYWCSNGNKSKRSNQVTVRTSGRCSNLQIRLCSSNRG